MARTFNGSTSHIDIYATGNTIPITAFPFTLAATAYANDTTAAGGIIHLGKVAAGVEYSLSVMFRGDVVGDPIAPRRIYNGSGFSTPQSSSYSTGTWYRVACVFASATDTRLYIDNTKYTSSDSVDFPVSTSQWFTLGARTDKTTRNSLNGGLQECAAWDIALSDDDVNSLYKGFSPMRVRPDRLQMYYPSTRDNNTVMVAKGGIVMKNNASTGVTAHHRTYGW